MRHRTRRGSAIPLPGACTGAPSDWSITTVSTTTDDFKPGINATIQATVGAFRESADASETLTFHPSNP